MVYYLIPSKVGIESANSLGDGTTIAVKWHEAKPSNSDNKIAYNIYYSKSKVNIFQEGPKLVSIDSELEINVIGLDPGQEYYFSVRPIEYNPNILDLTILPILYDNLRYYPTTLLVLQITQNSLQIPVLDIEGFPSDGIIKVGVELINYSFINKLNNTFNLNSISQRGYSNTKIRSHNVDGYDGYYTQDPIISFYIDGENTNFDRIYACQSRFEFPYNAFTFEDGYKQVTKDILTTDMTVSDESNAGFPVYDYAGYHRTDPVALFQGLCVGSYIGGERGCIDGYGNVNIVRGLPIKDIINQREEVLLTLTGRPAILLKAMRTGVICSCYDDNTEYPDDRCPHGVSSKFIVGYEQHFDNRRSDGKILIRVGPADENLRMTEAGLESELPLDAWSLVIPTIKTRDVIILYDNEGNEEFRYEVLYVTRNNTLLGEFGGQKMKLARMRKTDPIYQFRVFKDSSMFPSNLTTSIGGNQAVLPHSHTIRISEKITSVSQINQVTSVSQGHAHEIVAGVVQISLNHSHTILLT